MPNRITEYLYSLSEAFNSFYTECKVLGSHEKDSQVLSDTTAPMMLVCLQLLRITALHRTR